MQLCDRYIPNCKYSEELTFPVFYCSVILSYRPIRYECCQSFKCAFFTNSIIPARKNVEILFTSANFV